MKILEEDKYLSKQQWDKIFIIMAVLSVTLYIFAMIFSLCGSTYFILNYQNEQMDKIENFLKDHHILGLVSAVFNTIEFGIVSCFVLRKKVTILLPFIFYLILVIPACFIDFPEIYYTILPFVCYFILSIVFSFHDKKFDRKLWLGMLLRILIAFAVILTLEVMIFVIKSGKFSFDNHYMNLSAHFVYAIESDIALSVILYSVSLLINREKGDGKRWTISHTLGLSSQTSKKQSQKSNTKINLTKTQKNKLRLLYARFYLTQLGAFLLLMVLPFLVGKVFEFLVMYLAFAVTRYALGFKYSLHFKKETLCITVGVVVFGILSLAVPFFSVLVIIAIVMGIGLAVLLHLSYRYEGLYLFNKISKPDKFATLYVLMDGDLTPHHVEVMCHHKGVDDEDIKIMVDFAEGNKKSYIAKKYNYSEKTIERKINEALAKLDA